MQAVVLCRGTGDEGFACCVWDAPRFLTAASATRTANFPFSHTGDGARVKKSVTRLALIAVLVSLGRMF